MSRREIGRPLLETSTGTQSFSEVDACWTVYVPAGHGIHTVSAAVLATGGSRKTMRSEGFPANVHAARNPVSRTAAEVILMSTPPLLGYGTLFIPTRELT